MENQCKKCSRQQNCYKSSNFVHTDSFVEEVFVRKCQENLAYEKLYLEWIDSKCIYVRYTNLSRGDYGNFSKHDYSHSINILNAITSVLGHDIIEKLGVANLWMLLHCAYGHDIGMPYSFKQMHDFWKELQGENGFSDFFKECLLSEDKDIRKAAKYIDGIYQILNLYPENEEKKLDEKYSQDWPARVYRYTSYLTSEYVRRNHALNSQKIMEDCELFNRSGCAQVEPRFYKILGTCYMLHTQNEEEVCKKLVQHEWDGVTDNCHPRFIAFLLRLGDLLDIDNNRFDAIDLEHYGNIPELSVLNKKKHESIVHIKYAKGIIEISSKSDDSRVCKLASDWFNYLKREIQYISLHWTEIAPACIGGCTFSEPKIEVFLGEEKFYGIQDEQFKVDKGTLLDLVIGRNLYKSTLDFLREYLQNAIDASKMRFWLDFQNGDLDHYLLDENKKRKIERVKIQPFDFSGDAFLRYPIEVECDYISAKRDKSVLQDVVRIEILDHGIGIDKECVDAISNIGTGWNKRKKYAKELDSMPCWLKPTGGFGIGMQSGFMITDKVKIETRCEDEVRGRELVLYSNDKNGRIEIKEKKIRQQGTKITVDIPYKWFMDGDNYKAYSMLKLNRVGIDFMNPHLGFERISDFLAEYVKIILGDSLLPIRVKQKNFKAKEISGFVNKCPNKYKEFIWDDNMYFIFAENGSDNCIIWDLKNSMLCKIDGFSTKIKQGRENWYYKGVKVWTDEDSDRGAMYPYIGVFTIDILGMPVRECLTVDRIRFKKDFDYRGLSNKFALVYLNYLAKEQKIIPENPDDEVLLRSLLAYKFVLGYEYREEIKNKITALQQKEAEEIENLDMKLKVGMQKCIGGVKENDELVPVSIYTFLRNIWNEEKVIWYTEKGDAKVKELISDSDIAVFDFVGERAIRINPISMLIKTLLGQFYEKEDGYFKFGNRYVYQHKNIPMNIKIKEEKNMVFRKKTVEGREIYYTNEFFEMLYVSKIPFDLENHSDKNIIISPVPGMLSSDDFIKNNVEGREDAESDYIKLMTEDETFELLIDWVYDYQIQPQKYSKDQIRKEYIELLKYLYKENVSPLLNKY